MQVLAQYLPKTEEAAEERAQLKEFVLNAGAFRTQVLRRQSSLLDVLTTVAPHSQPSRALPPFPYAQEKQGQWMVAQGWVTLLHLLLVADKYVVDAVRPVNTRKRS